MCKRLKQTNCSGMPIEVRNSALQILVKILKETKNKKAEVE